MYIDYVRIYQEEGKELLTCDPRMCTLAGWRCEAGVLTDVAGYETTEYIQEHLEPYMNANMTVGFLFQMKVRVLTFADVVGDRLSMAQEQAHGRLQIICLILTMAFRPALHVMALGENRSLGFDSALGRLVSAFWLCGICIRPRSPLLQ